MARLTSGYAFDEATPPWTGPILRAPSCTVALVMDLVISASNALSVKGHRFQTSNCAAYSLLFRKKGESSSSESETEYSLASHPTILQIVCRLADWRLDCSAVPSGEKWPGWAMDVLMALIVRKAESSDVLHAGSTLKILVKRLSSLNVRSKVCLIKFRDAVSTERLFTSFLYSSKSCWVITFRPRSRVVR